MARTDFEQPTTRFATTRDGLSIAYQRFGAGDHDLVYMPGTLSHVELSWELPGWRYLFERVASFSRFVKLDKRGSGLSDRHLGTGAPEDRIEDFRAVMDAEGIDRAVLFGHSEGGTLAALFSALYPERVDGLIMASSFAYGSLCDRHPRPEAARPAAEAMLNRLADEWGTGRAGSMWLDGELDTDLAGRIERYSSTPAAIVEYMRETLRIDVREILPMIQAPTLVVHGRHDQLMPFSFAEQLATAIPGAELVALDWGHGGVGEQTFEPMIGAVEEWLTGRRTAPVVEPQRVLATVLFTDLVGSTDRATELGDGRWRQLLDRHDVICHAAMGRHQGRLVKLTGDGIVATFDGPGRAIDCAHEVAGNLAGLGLAIRAGIHTGEIELRGDDIAGLAVHLAARVQSQAIDGEVWVTPVVPSLVVGSGHQFEARGTHKIKGFDGQWELSAATGRLARA
ncbi:MAG: adenylate/guanylate cyclase domain-containing protein [Acidimicrobiia bacterium]|nr:adenylate/guanylate cyclase domain-containing protein [Acidimicrobiia bacterium]